MTIDLYTKLESFAQTDSSAVKLDDSGHGFTDSSRLTLATINYYDNGPDIRGKWSSSRYALNWQMFDRTDPFTPSSRLAVWSGATQMHEPGFFEHYLEAKLHLDLMGVACRLFYKDLVTETLKMPKIKDKPAPMLGQFISKYPGSVYHYGAVTRMSWDEFDELTVELFLEQSLHATILVDQIANNLKDPKNLLRGRYDPKGLWRGKGKKKVKP
ncbi:hypothetical protein J2X36_004546 [Methylobacterium sp. BE186]|uniref:hypothetical protein n=1 Tax=Methylobacterium sp. BE186 TaxID=2817715 RepID=UPI0028557528|nr:hypothetical protein [Methylobacterium sp. BE186]MDR7039768.1 hypothetical protein [Methylobacterium sp. BE186]